MEPVDLSQPQYSPTCAYIDHGEPCGKPAEVMAKGCMDKEPALLCAEHLKLSVKRVEMTIRAYQQLNKRVLICGDCYRPILTLDTHIDIKDIQ